MDENGSWAIEKIRQYVLSNSGATIECRNYAVTMQWPAALDTKQKYTRVSVSDNKLSITAIPENALSDTMPFTQKDFSDSNTVVSLDSAFCFAAYDAKLVNCDTGVTGISAEIKINGDSGYKVLINKNGQIGQTSP